MHPLTTFLAFLLPICHGMMKSNISDDCSQAVSMSLCLSLCCKTLKPCCHHAAHPVTKSPQAPPINALYTNNCFVSQVSANTHLGRIFYTHMQCTPPSQNE